ncbi:hypothetical protein AB9F26_09295 [Falsihalocynthiibacter sp. BN13B15]|uniref:hypothetical protein n=1 Tax=Falsihalocynthiibacter sp. BN13B15 TaxID=3240871 RepID=UPI00350F617A
MSKSKYREAQFWWQVTPVLPPSKTSRDYHILRRLWGDHTMNTARGGRGYYHWGTEDNMTPGLFQIWSMFPGAMRPLIEATGMRVVGEITFITWAYACEEAVERGHHPGVNGRFLIPDIVIYFEDGDGPGIVSFEVKRPGVKPVEKDADKLRAYTMLRSMDRYIRRKAIFLLSDDMTEVAKNIAPDLPAVTWENMMRMQIAGANTLSEQDAKHVGPWISRAYSRYGIGDLPAPLPASPAGYGSALSIAAISNKMQSEQARNFVWGSEIVEAFLSGRDVEPPTDWMKDALSREAMSAAHLQKTRDRRINRWHPDWQIAYERALP